MKADIDSVRERDELVPHTDDILNEERESLLSPFLNDSEYVDSIYDRIETKKNLEQIIVYGVRIGLCSKNENTRANSVKPSTAQQKANSTPKPCA